MKNLKKIRIFSYFDIIGHNLFRRFEKEHNNNNNNLLLLLEFRRGFERSLKKEFNSLLEENSERLDSNIAALVNTLVRVNLEINYIERESNYIKLTEFRGIEAKDHNEWLE